MKKLLLSATIIILAASCSKTTNDKAEALIEEDMKKTLVRPDSYKAIETETDSAFAPMDDPMLYSLLLDIARENVVMSDADATIIKLRESMESSAEAMNMAVSQKRKGYKDDYEKFNKINVTCKTEIAHLENAKDSIINLIGNKLEIIKSRLNAEHQFIGFKAVQKYKAINNLDNELNDSCYYLFDKNFKKVVLSLPLKEYRSLSETLNVIKEGFASSANDTIK